MSDAEVAALGSLNVGRCDDVGHFVSERALGRFAKAYADAFRSVPSGWEAIDAQTSLGRVRAYRFGQGGGDPLVLLSGRNAAAPMWASTLPALIALGRPVVCIDPLGEAGGSRQTSAISGRADHAEWIEQTLADLDIGRAHLVGASLGGWVALCAAVSDRVASVTVIDPPAVFTRLRIAFVVAGLTASQSVTPIRIRRRLLAWIAGGDRVGDGEDPVARLGEEALLGFRVRQPVPTTFTDDDLKAIDVPVLALIAGRSSCHDPRCASERAQLLRRGAVEVWPDAGHTMNVQFPDRFALRLGEFLSEA